MLVAPPYLRKFAGFCTLFVKGILARPPQIWEPAIRCGIASVMDILRPNRPRANPADPEIVRELIAVARKERASLHSLVASFGNQISQHAPQPLPPPPC